FARFDPPPLAAEPFAIHQSSARQLHTDAASAQPFNRLAIQIVCDSTLRQERTRASLNPQRPLRSTYPRPVREILQRRGGDLDVTSSRRRFDQLGQRPGRVAEVTLSACALRSAHRGIVEGEPGVEYRAGVS